MDLWLCQLLWLSSNYQRSVQLWSMLIVVIIIDSFSVIFINFTGEWFHIFVRLRNICLIFWNKDEIYWITKEFQFPPASNFISNLFKRPLSPTSKSIAREGLFAWIHLWLALFWISLKVFENKIIFSEEWKQTTFWKRHFWSDIIWYVFIQKNMVECIRSGRWCHENVN